MAGRIREVFRAHAALILVGFGVVLGGLALAFTEQAARRSESIEFCISCHVMEATVFEEYRETPHYANALGVQVTCADCHIPDRHAPGQVLAYLGTKLNAARFVWGWATGKTSEPKQLLDRRAELAERVWAVMRKDDSRACRRCHDDDQWVLDEQTTRAREQHLSAVEEGKTCIDCHDDGLAHKAVARVVPESELEQNFMLE